MTPNYQKKHVLGTFEFLLWVSFGRGCKKQYCAIKRLKLRLRRMHFLTTYLAISLLLASDERRQNATYVVTLSNSPSSRVPMSNDEANGRKTVEQGKAIA